MPDYTAFLNLTLAELNEFVDSWNEPLNQNFEDLDAWLQELHDNLVGVGATAGTGTTWATLRGNLDSLAERINLVIDDDGKIDISSSADVLDMATSAVRGVYSAPRDRLDAMDLEVYDVRLPVVGGRFTPPLGGSPVAGFPPENLEAGIAIRGHDFGVKSGVGEADSTPIRQPWAPGLVWGGASPFLIATGNPNQIVINSTGSPALFNIDGYIFRIREGILLDYSAFLTGGTDYVWVFVERDNYNASADYKYSEVGGTPVQKDLRQRKSGTGTGNIGGTPVLNEFSVSSGGTFDTAPWTVKEGDILVITSGGDCQGSYVIDALDGSTPNSKLTIKGKFYGTGSSVNWYIYDAMMPNIGVEQAATNPNLLTSKPPLADGRVYIGLIKQNGGSPPSTILTFAKNGVYDSGWITGLNAGSFPAPLNREHALGCLPSSVELWVREDATTPVFRPLVRRQLVTKMNESNFPNPVAGDANDAYFWVPSMHYHCTETEINVYLENQSTDPALGPSLFTDESNTEKTSGELRIIVRR